MAPVSRPHRISDATSNRDPTTCSAALVASRQRMMYFQSPFAATMAYSPNPQKRRPQSRRWCKRIHSFLSYARAPRYNPQGTEPQGHCATHERLRSSADQVNPPTSMWAATKRNSGLMVKLGISHVCLLFGGLFSHCSWCKY